MEVAGIGDISMAVVDTSNADTNIQSSMSSILIYFLLGLGLYLATRGRK